MNNIMIGIDLGTTNSAVSILNNENVEIVKNSYGDETTPSVFGINKAKNEIVGKKAYEALFKDGDIKNFKAEVKRLMGTNEKIHFERINQDYNAEFISSRILHSLKIEANRKNNDINTNAAVITIPAYFQTIQCEATQRAGELAGFRYVVLLQEPIAAAISYGYGKNKDENWLVYDFGGGTFDTALISSQAGNLMVLAHNGDNFLGGKDIDNLIVDKIIVPELVKKYGLIDFSRENQAYRVEFSKLKFSAEQAKIQLSSKDSVDIEIDLQVDEKEIYENISLTQHELENLTQEIIDKTIHCCKNVIKEANVAQDKINRVILVGGPTQLPFIKKRLESELGIFVDNSSDPLTAVARGACIYAMSQNIPAEFIQEQEIDENTYELKLHYEPLTSDTEELITGIIPALQNTNEDYFVQIQSKDNTFNSDKIKLKSGKFGVNVIVQSNKMNLFWIYLFDKDGNMLRSSIDEFSITHGLSISGTPIPHNILVGISQKDYTTNQYKQVCDIFFEKDSILPLEETKTYKTVKRVSKNDSTNALPITIYEGEFNNPEHNTFICEVEIKGTDLKYDLPENSDVEVTVKIDKSRKLSLEAYIPEQDICIENARGSIYDEDLSVEELKSTLKKEVSNFEKLQDICDEEEKQNISKQIKDVEEGLKNAKIDDDEKRKTRGKLKQLQNDIEQLQTDKNIDIMIRNFKDLTDKMENYIYETEENFIKQFEAIKRDGNLAIKQANIDLLSRAIKQLNDLDVQIALNDDGFWLALFDDLKNNPHIYNNANAREHINQGRLAIRQNDIQTLKECASRLLSFMPRNELENINSKIAGITK